MSNPPPAVSFATMCFQHSAISDCCFYLSLGVGGLDLQSPVHWHTAKVMRPSSPDF